MEQSSNQRIVTVFCSSSERLRNHYHRAARKLGKLLAEQRWIVRNGAGGGNSLMGAVTDGAHEAGGEVRGVILDRFMHLKHEKLDWCEVYPTLMQRKDGLIRGAHAMVILPGGFGTLDELTEVLAMTQAGLITVPIVLVNVEGFYTPFLAWLKTKLKKACFIKSEDLNHFKVVRTPEQAVRELVKQFRI